MTTIHMMDMGTMIIHINNKMPRDKIKIIMEITVMNQQLMKIMQGKVNTIKTMIHMQLVPMIMICPKSLLKILWSQMSLGILSLQQIQCQQWKRLVVNLEKHPIRVLLFQIIKWILTRKKRRVMIKMQLLMKTSKTQRAKLKEKLFLQLSNVMME